MKRTYGFVAVALLVVAVIVGQRHWTGEDETAPPASGPSFDLQAILPTEDLQKAEQLLIALADLREDTAAYADKHKLVVTIRDEVPLEVWKLDGERCLTVFDGSHPTTVDVRLPDDEWSIAGHVVPVEAKLLESGACEATVTLAMEDAPAYDIRLVLFGRDLPEPTHVEHTGKSQSVTLVP